MSSAAGEIIAELLPVVGDGIAVLARTALGMIALAILLACGSYFIAGQGWPGLAAVGITVVLCAIASVFVAIKRAVLSVVRSAIIKVKLGERAVTALFAKMPTLVSGAAERVPLAQAEAMVRGGVTQLLDERASQTGFRAWLARQAQTRALNLVERVTLAEFRSADQRQGGVDLAIVRDHLISTVQTHLVSRINGMLTSVTALVIVGLSFVSLATAFLLGSQLHH